MGILLSTKIQKTLNFRVYLGGKASETELYAIKVLNTELASNKTIIDVIKTETETLK